jgi:hypothetical protein
VLDHSKWIAVLTWFWKVLVKWWMWSTIMERKSHVKCKKFIALHKEIHRRASILNTRRRGGHRGSGFPIWRLEESSLWWARLVSRHLFSSCSFLFFQVSFFLSYIFFIFFVFHSISLSSFCISIFLSFLSFHVLIFLLFSSLFIFSFHLCFPMAFFYLFFGSIFPSFFCINVFSK